MKVPSPNDRRLFGLGVCPSCGSGRISVRRTVKPYRRVKCRVCGHQWDTIELIIGQHWLIKLLDEALRQGLFAQLPYSVVISLYDFVARYNALVR